MHNRFGIKDFLVVLLLLALLATQWFSMIQRDRQWPVLQGVAEQLKIVDERLAGVEARLAQGLPTAAQTSGASGAPQTAIAMRDESWARPGVPVQWQPEPGFANDPAKVPGFKVGGEWVEVFEGQPQKLTPYLYADVYGSRVGDRVCESMASFDPKTMQLAGVLADAWQIDPDGKWIRVHINPRAKFSDGVRVTAEDVRWTYQDFILNESIDADRTRSTLADILGAVTVVDAATIEFGFKDALHQHPYRAWRADTSQALLRTVRGRADQPVDWAANGLGSIQDGATRS